MAYGIIGITHARISVVDPCCPVESIVSVSCLSAQPVNRLDQVAIQIVAERPAAPQRICDANKTIVYVIAESDYIVPCIGNADAVAVSIIAIFDDIAVRLGDRCDLPACCIGEFGNSTQRRLDRKFFISQVVAVAN